MGPNNRLLSDGTYHYLYDAEGNRTHKFVDSGDGQLGAGDSDVTEYEWDHRNRLVRVVERESDTGPAVKIVEHTYDYLNRWVGRSVDGDGDGPLGFDDTYFVYDGTPSGVSLLGQVGQIVLHFEDDAQGDPQLAHRYLWGAAVDQILADEQVTSLTTPGEILWSLTDHLGTVRDLAQYDPGTTTATVVNHRVFNAFGQLLSETAPAVDHLFAFTGRALDESTGLQNNLNRWYDAEVGQWVGEDPIGFAAGDNNLRRYVGNSPTNATDPSGCLTSKARELLDRYNNVWDSLPVSDDRKVAALIIEALIVADGNAQEAFALVYEIRNASNGRDDIWAAAGHFFQSWTVRNHISPPLFAGSGAALANDVYHLLKLVGYPVGRDRPDVPPSPATPLQHGWGSKGAAAAIWFSTDLHDASPAERESFFRWIHGLKRVKPVPPTPTPCPGGWSVCFREGTQVHTETGLQDIETVSVGTRVWSYDHEQHVWGLMPVSDTEAHDFIGAMVTIKVGEDTIEATTTHPFWVVSGESLETRPSARIREGTNRPSIGNGRWVAAGDLQSGDVLLARDGGLMTIASTEMEEKKLRIHNLLVDQSNNYAVGNSGLLVNNM